MMKLLVDGVCFQLAETGISRVWLALLQRLAKLPNLEIALLDRGNCPSIGGIDRVEFPSYTLHAYTAADSIALEQHCRRLGADIFSSTSYTTPLRTPSVMLVYDMVPTVPDFDLTGRDWQERQIAISFASYYACISQNIRSVLNRFYPATTNRSTVTHCGVEHQIFRPQDHTRVDDFKKRFGISKPYFLFVGPREQGDGYNDGIHAFNSAREIPDFEFEFLCIGGEKSIGPEVIFKLPPNLSVRRLDLSDPELACAYSGAEALVFASLRERFEMSVAEPMACGCPVIAAKSSWLAEVTGDAAIFVSGCDENEMRSAMMSVRGGVRRAELVENGLQRAAIYDWAKMAREFHGLLKKAYEESGTPAMKRFFDRWQALRRIQADVDVAN
jgi:glycosyltransferase involved in cell wall biosynthesis